MGWVPLRWRTVLEVACLLGKFEPPLLQPVRRGASCRCSQWSEEAAEWKKASKSKS